MSIPITEEPLCFWLKVSRAKGAAQDREEAARELREIRRWKRVFHEQEEERKCCPACTIKPYESNFLPSTSPRRVTFSNCIQFEDDESDSDNIPDEATINTASEYPLQFENDRGKTLPSEPYNSPTPEWGLQGVVSLLCKA